MFRIPMSIITAATILTLLLIREAQGMGENSRHKSTCKQTAGKETYTLVDPPQQNKLTLRKNAQAILEEYPSTVKVSISRRTRWTHYCEGAFQNNPCTTKTESFPLDIEEIEDWERNKKCHIGYLCPPYGECWGSDADRCLSDWRGGEVERREHTWVGQSWLVKWRYSCIASWECLVEITELPLLTKPSTEEGDTGLFTFDGSDRTIEIPKKDFRTPIELPNGMRVHILSNPWEKKTKKQDITCLVREGTETSCLWQESGQAPGIPFLLSRETFKSFYRNMALIVTRIETVREGGAKTVIGAGADRESSPILKDFDMLGKAASVEDLKEILMEMSYRQLEVETNLYIERENRIEMERRYTQLVKSVSKIDDELIPNLLRINAKTEWVNEETFRIHPCANRTYSPYTNCDQETVFTKGRRRIKEGSDFCFSIAGLLRSSINLFNDSNIRFDLLRRDSPMSTAAEWDGWSSIHDFGRDIMKSVATDVNPDRGAGSQPLGSLFPEWLVGSGVVAYISLIISLIAIVLIVLRK